MRSEREMFGIILDVARRDARVRAVYMNGSRTNPNVQKDQYQDYDIVFVVTETASFLADKNWISIFGELAIVQEPDSRDFGWGLDHDCFRSYTWLMLFKDGSRIDLGIKVLELALEDYSSDTLCKKLLDKDTILPPAPEANDSMYWIQPPTKPQYAGCCNEFWWCLNNVAKGIARDQMPYALRMYHQTVHNELEKMTEWYIGSQHHFSITTGKFGKYLKQYLPPDTYEQYMKTYPLGQRDSMWNAVFTACSLFRYFALSVADDCGYIYNMGDDENMASYLTGVQKDCHSV